MTEVRMRPELPSLREFLDSLDCVWPTVLYSVDDDGSRVRCFKRQNGTWLIEKVEE
jgi:hypothetical protein